MGISLKTNETIIKEVNFHWSAFLMAKIWASFGLLMAIASFLPNEDDGPNLMVVAIVFWTPFAYKWLENKCKKYIVTNQRVYIEEGILSKNKKDIMLSKINDVSVNQNLVQRIFGSGNLALLTGNDKGSSLRDIDTPDEFKNIISEAIENLRAA